MKKILILTGALTLLMTTGCLVSEGHHGGRGGHHRGHGRHAVHGEIRVHTPEIIVQPPAVIVR